MSLHQITYKNKYRLSYAEYGNSDGFPILVQHGIIASIKDGILFQQLINLGTRVISIARPGYGESSVYNMKNVAEWGEIVSVLIDELHLAEFDVLGISSGAPYCYSIGYRFPKKTRNIFILSGIPALYNEKVVARWPYEVKKDAVITEMQKLARELFFSSLTQEDFENNAIKDSIKNDCFGPAQDLRIRGMDWGFKLSDIKPAVTMRHSRTDNFETAVITSQLLPNCTLDARENDAHFSQEILDDFIQTSMAKHYTGNSGTQVTG